MMPSDPKSRSIRVWYREPADALASGARLDVWRELGGALATPTGWSLGSPALDRPAGPVGGLYVDRRTDDFVRRHLLVVRRVLLLVHGDLDLHHDLRRHLPPQRPDRRHEGRLDHRAMHPAVPRRDHLYGRAPEGDRPGRAADDAGRGGRKGGSGRFARRRDREAPGAAHRRRPLGGRVQRAEGQGPRLIPRVRALDAAGGSAGRVVMSGGSVEQHPPQDRCRWRPVTDDRLEMLAVAEAGRIAKTAG